MPTNDINLLQLEFACVMLKTFELTQQASCVSDNTV